MTPRQLENYRLDTLLGSGEMGAVYQAYDTDRDRYVALKLLPEGLSGDPEYLARFQRESQVAALLREPHVIPIHDFGEIDGHIFIDMPLVDGTDIGALIDANDRLDPERAVNIVSQVAQALDAAHADGLVHGDIKPSNILVTANDFVYVVDFGMARPVGGRPAALASTGATTGTLHYMAPERIAGRDVDGRADVYSLACVLHECLTGAPPFTGKDDLPALMYAHLYSAPAPASSLVDGVPPALDAVIARAMAKHPDGRFATAGALAAAASEALLAEVPAPPPVTEHQAPPVTEHQAPPVTGPQAPPVTEAQAPPVTGPQAPPVTEAQAPPVTEAQAPPVTEAQAPPVTEAPTPPVTELPSPAWTRPAAAAWTRPAATQPTAPPMTELPVPAWTDPPVPAWTEPPAPVWPPAPAFTAWPDAAEPSAREAEPAGPARTIIANGTGTGASDWGGIRPLENLPQVARPELDGDHLPPGEAPGGPAREPSRRRLGLLLLASAAALAVPVVIVLVVSAKPGTSAAGTRATSVSVTTSVGPTGAPGVGAAQSGPGAGVPGIVLPTVARELTVGKNPSYIKVAPNGRFAYVADPGAGVITVLNTTTDRVAGTVKIPQGPPQFVSFSPDSRTAYVSVYNPGNAAVHLIAFIDTATGTVTSTVQVDNFTPGPSTTSPDGRFLYVPNHNTAMTGVGENVIDVIDTATGKLTGHIAVPANPHWVVFGKNGLLLYTTDHMSAKVTVVNAATGSIVADIPVGETPHSEDISPAGRRLAVTSFEGNEVFVINTATDRMIAQVPVGRNPVDIAYSRDGKYLYTVNNEDNSVTVINTADNLVVGTIKTGKAPTSISLLPNGRQAYVTDENDGTVEILNLGS